MKALGPLTWCRLSKLLNQWRWKTSGFHAKHTRCIFSKTGEWDQRLTNETRLEIEEHWRPIIKEHDARKAEETKATDCKKPKFYALSMFPYPSGNLHIGHIRVYTISDVMARYQQAQGKAVIHPIGWDAFGLPAENAAIERGVRAKDWTYSNIKRMKQQLKKLGLSFDWSREVATCDPLYYKWTQWIFLKMYEKGLAFQKKGLVNWDPVDMTVLADEQIDDQGCSWRSGAKVEQKYLTQWYLRTTAFSQSLLDGLNEIDSTLWRDIIKLQKNWISECNGYRVEFEISQQIPEGSDSSSLSIYTEDVDLIYGVSHICVKASSYLCVDCRLQEEGTVLPVQAIHPFTNKPLSLVVTNEKEMFENRDTMLAIPSISKKARLVADQLGFSYHDVLSHEDKKLINSNELNGLHREEAAVKTQEKLMAMGAGGEPVSERLNDWLISRQRYWGTPIPIIHCDNCGAVPVPYKDLPVELPDVKIISTKGGQSPLAENEKWLHTACPKCSASAKRETDTMDTFVDSTWYFLRYLDTHNQELPFDPALAKKYMPVDLYVGGKEHAVLHLYFARFVCHFLNSIGLLPYREPFSNLLTQGMVKGQSYRVKETGKYIPVDQVDLSGKKPVEKSTGAELVTEYEKMSKSKYNGVEPEDVLREFGVDSTRLCIVSNVSPHSDRNWSNEVYKGVLTWQGKVWTLVTSFHNCRILDASTDEKEHENEMRDTKDFEIWESKIDDIRNHIINNVNFQMDVTFHINSAISRLHSFTSWLSKVPLEISRNSRAYERALGDLLVMISPIAPHFTSELWVGLRSCTMYDSHDWACDVLDQRWPQLDDDFMMPLTYRINNVDVSELGVPYKMFNQLTSELALSLVLQDPSFCQLVSQPTSIENYQLKIDKGFKALLSLKIPGLDVGIDKAGSSAEKSKQAKKLGKQKKKLRTMEMDINS
ncbi:leucine--tRNA ligase [Plakobranchus ocellatus]|uniref:leucine--tRNA ligase n=1 Tax=Plakobranchus ocellatus TaxID=259542 RepID=A0AAV4A5T6_9GAST|nr:leucine--tRNA ligase [Plakobranchus ocellatus]